MSHLRHALADYLILRRALGYKMDKAERLLGQFVGFAEGPRRNAYPDRDGAGLGDPTRGSCRDLDLPASGRGPPLRTALAYA